MKSPILKNITEKVVAQDTILELQQIIEKKTTVLQHLKKCIEILEEYLRLARHKQFAPSSEANPSQGEIFYEGELAAFMPEKAESVEEHPDIVKYTSTQKKRGRKEHSPSIPGEQIFINLTVEEYDKVCCLLNLIPLGCWDHCRQKFVEAQAAQPKTAQARTKADITLIKFG